MSEKHNIWHGDVKPVHIFIDIDNNDAVSLIDFGLSHPFVPSKLNRCEIEYLNRCTFDSSYSYCGIAFKKYVNPLYDGKYEKERGETKFKIAGIFIGFILIVLVSDLLQWQWSIY